MPEESRGDRWAELAAENDRLREALSRERARFDQLAQAVRDLTPFLAEAQEARFQRLLAEREGEG